MSKWLESLGFGAQKPKRNSPPAIARLRETMRWRGYDLTPYSDEEIDAARRILGDGVSETGETTHDSREALFSLLKERRTQGIAPGPMPECEPEPEPQDEPDRYQSAPEAAPEQAEQFTPAERLEEDAPQAAAEEPSAAPSPQEEETPVAATSPVPRTGRQPRASATPLASLPEGYKPAPGRYKSPLLLAWHSFGFHAWTLRDDPPGVRLRCEGCGAERPAGRNARMAAPAPPPVERGKENSDGPPRQDIRSELPPEAAREAWSSDRSIDDPSMRTAPAPRPAAPRPRPGATGEPTLFQRFLQSPWWVKTIAFFFVLQVVRIIMAVFGGGEAS